MDNDRRIEVFNRMQSGNVDRLALAGLVHDLRNVLAVIVGWLDLARQTRGDAEAGEALEKALDGLPRCHDLLEQVEKVAKGPLVTVPRRSLAGPVIAQTLAVVKAALPQNIRLHREVPFDLWPVAISAGDIDRMLVNLLQNGWEAMPDGGTLAVQACNIAIETNAGSSPEASLIRPGKYVRVSVTDSGTGLSPEVQARIFEPYFSTKPPGKGAGLGLATVRSLVGEREGFIDFETSSLGTTFNVYLPVATD